MICDAGDVAVVPFPFSDLPVAKARPAVVISSAVTNDREGETLLAMVTTAAAGGRPGDTRLTDLAAAGLKTPCVVRLKLFTLDNRLIARRIGALSDLDRSATRIALARLIAL
jgi:mRNA interferase MazF